MKEQEARQLTDHELERELRDALKARKRARVEALRAEARRRFAGMHGLPGYLMEDTDGSVRV